LFGWAILDSGKTVQIHLHTLKLITFSFYEWIAKIIKENYVMNKNNWSALMYMLDNLICDLFKDTVSSSGYMEYTWKVYTDFGHKFHVPKQEKMSILTCVQKHLICEL
jgi:hypothetical protein